MTVKLLYLVSHPIQYQAPLLRKIDSDPYFDLQVLFEGDFSDRPYRDKGFGVDINWDVPLRSGYTNALMGEVDLEARLRDADALWVHGWQSAGLKQAIGLARGVGTPVLMRGENWAGAMPDGAPPAKWAKRFYRRRIFEKCSAFLAIGTQNRAYYQGYGIPQNRIFPVPYAVDNDFFSSRATDDAVANVRKRHGIDPQRKVILYAGKLTRRKHPEMLLAARERMAGRDAETPLVLVVGDGEMRAELQRWDSEGVIFTGFKNQSEMPAYYATADLFVLMAEREPWGLAVNEAMASGTGVIVSDEVGAAYDLVDQDTGLMVPAGDLEGLVAAIMSALEQSADMGRAATAKIQGWNFNADLDGLKAAIAHLS
ncbi:MAG: glycosyltransferase family 4 protein [Pseudomonadota bacterium]|nr:glycosyltransferase family 4 protein [Pseudomonadota bacterium]